MNNPDFCRQTKGWCLEYIAGIRDPAEREGKRADKTRFPVPAPEFPLFFTLSRYFGSAASLTASR